MDSPPPQPDPGSSSEELSREGQSIGPYRLTRLLGRGGMGVVYEAVHEQIGQRVAIKLLARQLTRTSTDRTRFLREARAGVEVRHSGLVQVFGYGELPDGTPYIVLELLEGCLLRAFLEQNPDRRLPITLGLQLGQQIATAIAALHARGIVHRDLKPDNMMLVADAEASGEQRVRVLDFGIVKFTQSPELASLQSQGLLGTPLYMSPEQCRRDRALDGRSDVYSLGVVLYEMLCGRPPFQLNPEDRKHILHQHLYGDPRPPRAIRAQLSPTIDKLLLRMLDKVPERRPDMQQVARALAAEVSKNRPAVHRSLLRQGLGWIDSRRGKALLLIILALAAAFFVRTYLQDKWRDAQPAKVRVLPASGLK